MYNEIIPHKFIYINSVNHFTIIQLIIIQKSLYILFEHLKISDKMCI